MLKIYGIKNCNSMKKAFELLKSKNLAYEFHDYKKEGIDAATLHEWITTLGAEQILNKRGTTWRKLSEDQQQFALANEKNLIEVLIQYPSLIKRPILKTETDYLVGFNPNDYEKLHN